MTDVVDSSIRSKNMAAIHDKNTKPELIVRKFLHNNGYRYRIHRKDLPGKPDLVLAKFHLVIFVHGCFWHRHHDCHYASQPETRAEFWEKKLQNNVARDAKHNEDLMKLGWRVLEIWECGLKHSKTHLDELFKLIEGTQQHSVWPSYPPRRARNRV